MTAFETEVAGLKTELAGLVAAGEKRSALLASIAEGREPEAVAVRSFPSPGTAPERRDAANSDPFDTIEYRRAFMAHVLRGAPIPVEFRADEITLTADLGAAIPTTTLNRIIEKLEAVGMILPLVTRTAYKGGLAIPKSTAKPVATWVAEGAGSDSQKKATPGTITFAYHKLRCKVAVSLEVDTMALSAFESALMNNVVEAMTKALELAIISGDGAGKPKGILTEAAAAGQNIESAAPSYQDLIDAEAALPEEYENGAVWCMSKKTFMQYYGLTDETGQPIGRVNYGIAGKPERSLLGRPVVTCKYVPSYAAAMASGTIFAFLFNFADYVLNTNYAMGVKKYDDNETDDKVTKAIMLVDGKTVDAGSLVTVVKS
jgi:HK97 family phage major capsid protein